MINHLVLNTSYFRILLSAMLLFSATMLSKKTSRLLLFTPLLVSMVFGVAFFYLTGAPYKTYKIGGDTIYFFLEPATVCSAIPLYKKRETFVKHWRRIVGGVGIGTVVALLIILAFMKLAQFANDVVLSVLPQAVTTAIVLSVSVDIGGVKESTSSVVILNGVIIYVLDNKFLKLLRITSPAAQGLAFGTSGHALDIAPAKGLEPVEGSMASIVLVLVGVVVVTAMSAFIAIFL